MRRWLRVAAATSHTWPPSAVPNSVNCPQVDSCSPGRDRPNPTLHDVILSLPAVGRPDVTLPDFILTTVARRCSSGGYESYVAVAISAISSFPLLSCRVLTEPSVATPGDELQMILRITDGGHHPAPGEHRERESAVDLIRLAAPALRDLVAVRIHVPNGNLESLIENGRKKGSKRKGLAEVTRG